MKQVNRKKRNCLVIDSKTICDALTKSKGYLNIAAKMLQKSGGWMTGRCKDDPIIQEHLRSITEERVDQYEVALDELRDELNPTAIIFYLKTKGRSRGYVEHAPQSEVDLHQLESISSFFGAIAKASEKPPESKSNVQASPAVSPVKTSQPVTNFP